MCSGLFADMGGAHSTDVVPDSKAYGELSDVYSELHPGLPRYHLLDLLSIHKALRTEAVRSCGDDSGRRCGVCPYRGRKGGSAELHSADGAVCAVRDGNRKRCDISAQREQ